MAFLCGKLRPIMPKLGSLFDYEATSYQKYEKLNTLMESWHQFKCIDAWALGCTARESCLKLQCPYESVKKSTVP